VKGDSVFTHQVGQENQIAEIAGKAIQTPNEDMRYVSGLYGSEELLETRATHVLSGQPRIAYYRHLAEVTQRRVCPELVSLPLD
jgi:hypothetical protein